MTIDIYTHFLPPRYAEALARSTLGLHPDAGQIGEVIEMFPNLCELDGRMRHMDKHRVSMQALTPLPIPVEQFMEDRKDLRVADIVRLANDAMAEAVTEQSDRFVAVALLSFQHVESAVEELVRAVQQLGMTGGLIFTNIEGRPLDSPELDPLYEKVVELDVPLWMHPVSWDYYQWVRDYLIWQIFGWPFDTTLAMARLVYGGVLERFPRLKLITHHSGGTIPYLVGRIQDIYDQTEGYRALYSGQVTRENAAGNESAKTPLDYFRMFYNDVALSGWKPALECSYAFFGADQLVFGSDYPFSPENGERFVRTNLAAVKELEISTSDRRKILTENAKSLLKVK